MRSSADICPGPGRSRQRYLPKRKYPEPEQAFPVSFPQLAELPTGQLATMGDGLNPRCSRFPGAGGVGGRHTATRKRVVAAQPRRMNRVRHSSPPLLDKARLP